MACYALRRLATVTLVNKCKALKETDECQSKEIWCGQKHSFALVKKGEIFGAVEGKKNED